MKSKYENSNSLKSLFKNSAELMNKFGSRSYFLSFLSFALVGVVFIAVSFYKSLVFLGGVLALFLCFFSFLGDTELYASVYLDRKVRYKTSSSFFCFLKFDGHLISRIIRITFFFFLIASVITLVSVGILGFANKSMLENLKFKLDSDPEYLLNTPVGQTDFYLFFYPLYGVLAFMFALLFIYYTRKRQHIQGFMATQTNIVNGETFMYSAAPKIYGNKIHNRMYNPVFKNLYFINVASVLILSLGLCLGTYIGHVISTYIETFSANIFGLGFAFILYSFFNGFKSYMIVSYFLNSKEKSIEYLPEFLKQSFDQYIEYLKHISSLAKEDKLDTDYIGQMDARFKISRELLEKFYFYAERISKKDDDELLNKRKRFFTLED